MKGLLERLKSARGVLPANRRFVTVVSGLPRSGTSMMMKMLEAGGFELLTDGIRSADADNPKGYFEFERVKQLRKGDQAWLSQARGKAVKVISELLKWLPAEYEYRVIFMRRDVEEVLASQRAMLARKGKSSNDADDEKLAVLYREHVAEVESWLDQQPNVQVLYVNHGDLLADPNAQLPRLNDFLDGACDLARMAGIVDPALYRQRR